MRVAERTFPQLSIENVQTGGKFLIHVTYSSKQQRRRH